MLGGKSLAVFASAVNLKPSDGSLSATLNTHGIEKLLDGYGIHMNKDAGFDKRRAVPGAGHDAERPARLAATPGIAHVVNDSRMDEKEKLLDTSFAGFFRLDEVIFRSPPASS